VRYSVLYILYAVYMRYLYCTYNVKSIPSTVRLLQSSRNSYHTWYEHRMHCTDSKQASSRVFAFEMTDIVVTLAPFAWHVLASACVMFKNCVFIFANGTIDKCMSLRQPFETSGLLRICCILCSYRSAKVLWLHVHALLRYGGVHCTYIKVCQYLNICHIVISTLSICISIVYPAIVGPGGAAC